MEKVMLKGQREEIENEMKLERTEKHFKDKAKISDMLCLKMPKRSARGPNPKAMMAKKNSLLGKRKRRPRKGQRSRELSTEKKRAKLNEVN
jgi:hypothetical protein